jgi:Holliday junction resolvasome RuvABC ATP-dependent DNA helicase subunit
MALQALKMSYDPSSGSITFGVEGGVEGLDSIGNIINSESLLEEKLTDLLVELGSIASKTENTICFFVDEMQYLKKDNIEALACAMHKVSQKRLPIIMFGAGLPRVAKDFGDAKSYTERLFQFIEIGGLLKPEAKLAIVKPAEGLGKNYDEKSVNKIFEITEGYPYFIQEICKIIWNQADKENVDVIVSELVENSLSEFYSKLDASFFKSRFDRCSDSEREFIFAMVKCDKLPCTISNVANILNKEVQQISMTRATLIAKGIIYSTRYGEIDFTVPKFSDYLNRIKSSENKIC